MADDTTRSASFVGVRTAIREAAHTLDLSGFVDSLLGLPREDLGAFDPRNGWRVDELASGRDDDADRLVALFLVLAANEHADPGTLRRFAALHTELPSDLARPTAGAQPHREIPVPGMYGVAVDEGIAHLVGYLNAVGARTYYSCQGEAYADTGRTLVSVRRAAGGTAGAELVTSSTAQAIRNVLEETRLADLFETRGIVLDIHGDDQRAVCAAGYLMIDASDGGRAARDALRRLAHRAQIDDRRITSALEGDYLRHIPGPIAPDVWACVVLVEGLAVARYDFEEDPPFGPRITVHIPAESIARLDRAAKELLGDLVPVAGSNQLTPVQKIPYPATPSRTCERKRANGRLEEELTRRCPAARVRRRAGHTEGFTIDVPSGMDPEPVWDALRAAADRAELDDAGVLRFLQGSGPLWAPYTGNGLAVEVEYSLSRDDFWRRTVTVRQRRREAAGEQFPYLVRINILDKETTRALLSP